jgi:hypothetical protein
VQTFYQPFFSNSPLAILFPSAVSLQHFPISNSFPFSNPFAFQSLPTSKSQKPKASSKKPKAKSKSLPSSFSKSSGKQGRDAVLRVLHDIVTEETCVPASLNINNLGKAAVLHFPFLWLVLWQSQPTDKHFRKSS